MPDYMISNDERRQIEDFFRREFASLIRDLNRPVYHYTTGERAAAILDTATFRGTNVLYLGDGGDMAHAIEVFTEALNARRREGATSAIDGIVRDYLADTALYVVPDVWITTFTERRDHPDDWRKFSSAGHGVALGFQAGELRRAAISGGAFIAPCCYDDGTKIAIMERALATVDRLYAPHARKSGPVSDTGAQLVRHVIRQIALFGALMKRSHLADEAEWRMILVNATQTPVGARRIKAQPTPLYTSLYIDLEIGDPSGRLPLHDILVGPGEFQRLTVRAFHTLLYKHGYETATALPSSLAAL